MKTIKILAAVVLLCGASAVSYSLGKRGYDMVYNDACRMSDLIRHYEDDLRDSELDIQDWGDFEELEGLYLWDDAIGEPIDLKEYVYCY